MRSNRVKRHCELILIAIKHLSMAGAYDILPLLPREAKVNENQLKYAIRLLEKSGEIKKVGGGFYRLS